MPLPIELRYYNNNNPVIRKESLLAAQKEDLQRVDLLSLKEHHARSLLIHYRWDADKVFEVLVERGRDKLYAEAGVTLEGKDDHCSTLSTTEMTCQICFEDAPAEKTAAMDCNHRFCNDCWTTHFIVKINEGKSKRITCMAQKCNAISAIWLCGGATGLEHTWTSIRGHTCGSYKEGQEKKKTVNDLLRFTHYYERHVAHIGSLKVEADMKQKLHVKVLKLESTELQSKDFSWAENGFNRLLQSRRVLSCSYPVAFYIFGKALFENEMTPKEREIKQNLFENLQQQLEINVERLSMFLGEPFADYPEDKLLETKMKIITLSSVTDNLCKKLYDCIDNDLLVPL
uniref:RBR-type E3 ubiquitin transferase n=1 Tax=Nicotiana tabacum TaxID=4097 RepID=A0A1S4BM41_TOBAC|nr:PREDICTED: probable E3 ubiquitin-protein ligase ARI1 [Nicotiana tabacum]